ncbi:hypothetical protein MCHI_001606 [Candidatus Magnetoovum chiemensis]|nr:hypothetical protein MCHI_001606 [Candidatus Magnetoovum chiemensis]
MYRYDQFIKGFNCFIKNFTGVILNCETVLTLDQDVKQTVTAYCALLSVIETCKRRSKDLWYYIAQTIAFGRKGIPPLLIS